VRRLQDVLASSEEVAKCSKRRRLEEGVGSQDDSQVFDPLPLVGYLMSFGVVFTQIRSETLDGKAKKVCEDL